ncbi:MAG: asparaginase [Lachnospiraceae bacterium]|nr:asparaginase [Lachnospiraceae bacterium]
MKRIVTVFTGGTIGSRKSDTGEIAPDQNMSFRLLEMYQETVDKKFTGNSEREEESLIEFLSEEPYYILSENLTGRELFTLAECVKRYLAVSENIEGIIIMHGTDTLQYTAAFLGFLFAKASIPIVLVSSAYPLEDERANGLRNFCGAVDFIRGDFENGVFVSYANEGETVKIHRGTRLVRSLEYSADVFSAGNGFYGSFTEDGRFLKNPDFIDEVEKFPEDLIFTGEKKRAGFGQESQLNDRQEVRKQEEFMLTVGCPYILRIVPYVGMVYPEISEDVKVILMESYHSGTIGISESLKSFAEKAGKRKLPIYLTGLNREDTDYETVSGYTRLGIIPLRNKTAISQYVKLWILLSNGADIRRFME